MGSGFAGSAAGASADCGGLVKSPLGALDPTETRSWDMGVTKPQQVRFVKPPIGARNFLQALESRALRVSRHRRIGGNRMVFTNLGILQTCRQTKVFGKTQINMCEHLESNPCTHSHKFMYINEKQGSSQSSHSDSASSSSWKSSSSTTCKSSSLRGGDP